MAALPLDLVRAWGSKGPKEAWAAILGHASTICSAPLDAGTAPAEVTRRDREMAAADLFLSGSGWDLWRTYETDVERTSEALASWWSKSSPGRAILVLDGFSLREAPWILHGAAAHGLRIEAARVTGAELPGETEFFARALGFGQRSALENNAATGLSHRLQGARTDTTDLPWRDCEAAIGSERDWVFWHHWPDERAHQLGEAGRGGLEKLTADAAAKLTDEAFWSFARRLATGRRLIITSDHGYAASGHFTDATEEQAKRLKGLFKSGRWAEIAGESDGASPWMPPVDLVLETAHGRKRFVLGRRRWKSQGGYPSLAHGGLSVLEIAVPFIEIAAVVA